MLDLKSDTMKMCFVVFLITLLSGFIIFSPKVYAADYNSIFNSVIFNDFTNRFTNKNYLYLKLNGYSDYLFGAFSFNSDSKIIIDEYNSPGASYDGQPFVRFYHCGLSIVQYLNLNSLTPKYDTSYWNDSDVRWSLYDNRYDFVFYQPTNISYKDNIYICPSNVSLLDFYNNTILNPTPPDPVVSDIPTGSTNILGSKVLIFQDGNNIKRLVNSQPISLATDNTRYYKFSRGTDNFRIDTLVYDDGSFVWDYGDSINQVGNTLAPSITNGNIYFLTDDYTFISSDHDISIYDMTGSPIFVPSSDDPSTPIGGGDTPVIGPAITGFLPDQLPSEFKQAFDDGIFMVDTDINFNEYAYWLYLVTPNTNITQLWATDQPLRLLTDLGDNSSSYDLPYLVRTTDITKDIHFKTFIYDPNSTSEIYRKNTNIDNIVFSSSFFSDNYIYFNKSAISIGSMELVGANYDIFSATIDSSKRYVSDRNSVGFNKTTTGGGAALPTDPNDDYWNGIFQSIKSYIASWFVPSNNPFTGEMQRLQDKLGFMPLYNQLTTIFTGHNIDNASLPTFTINFGGKWGSNTDINILDLSWYVPYRNTIRIMLAVPIYLFVAIFLIKRIPSLLGGVMY